MTTHAMPAALGGRYTIDRLLGAGGYGEVYLAHDQQLPRTVVIKRLHPALASPRSRQRFAREGQALARLNHPHIIEIFDQFEEDGCLYQVMAYCAAGSLADLLAQPQYQAGLPVAEVIEIGKSLAGALQAAHTAGLIHRDIKPSNVLLAVTPEGWVPRLADFGIAALAGVPEPSPPPGTPAYLAPEQILAQAATPQTNIYALGIVLYRLLANRHYLTLEAERPAQRRRILTVEPTPLVLWRPDAPEWLLLLVHAMLAKEPRRRPTARQVYTSLVQGAAPPATLTRARQVTALPSLKTLAGWRRTGLILAAALAGALGLGLLLGLLLARPARPPTALVAARAAAAPLPTPPPTPEAVDLGRPVYAVITGTQSAGGLRLRAMPDLAAEVLAVLPDGTRVEVLAFRSYEEWVRVDAGAPPGQGWVFGRYLRLLVDADNYPAGP